MTVAALNLEPGVGARFFVEFVAADGTRRLEPLTACVTERLEDALPVRSFQWAKGTSHFPGSWWSSTTGDHVGFESWLERPVDRTNPRPEFSGPSGRLLRKVASSALSSFTARPRPARLVL